jgi:hypothetical protein
VQQGRLQQGPRELTQEQTAMLPGLRGLSNWTHRPENSCAKSLAVRPAARNHPRDWQAPCSFSLLPSEANRAFERQSNTCVDRFALGPSGQQHRSGPKRRCDPTSHGLRSCTEPARHCEPGHGNGNRVQSLGLRLSVALHRGVGKSHSMRLVFPTMRCKRICCLCSRQQLAHGPHTTVRRMIYLRCMLPRTAFERRRWRCSQSCSEDMPASSRGRKPTFRRSILVRRACGAGC